MQQIGGWILGICFAALACTLLEMLFPGGNMQKSARLVIAAFFLCALIVPAASGLKGLKASDFMPDVQVDASLSEGLASTINGQLLAAAQKNVERLAQNALQEIDLIPEKIRVTMDTGEDNSIVINKTEVWLDQEDKTRAYEVKTRLKSQLGLDATVYAAAE